MDQLPWYAGYIQSKTTNRGRTGGVTRIISISPNYKQNTSRVLEGDEELEGLKDFTLGFFGNIWDLTMK